MLDSTNLAEPLDVTKLEDEVSTLVGRGSSDPYAPPLRRSHFRLDRRLPEQRYEDHTEVAELTGAEDAEQAHDSINHPKHYTSHPSGIECITITRWMTFNLGNVFKYCWRADEKGATIEDLKKARWYLDDEIARLEKLAS